MTATPQKLVGTGAYVQFGLYFAHTTTSGWDIRYDNLAVAVQ